MSAWTESWLDTGMSEGRRVETLVRFMRTSVLEDFTLAARARALLLGPDEATAWARLPPNGAHRDSLAAQVLARCMLSQATGCDPGRVVLGVTPLGRPKVLAPAVAVRYRLSLGHADGLALCAIAADCDIGIDIASLRDVESDPLPAAEAIFSRRDVARLRALDPGLRPGRFLMLRTRMEALARARVYACSCVAGAFASDAGTAWRPPAPPGSENGVDASAGRVKSWRLTRDHLASVAVLGMPSAAIRIRLEEVVAEIPARLSPLCAGRG